LKIGIYGHPEKEKVLCYSSNLVEILYEKNIKCYSDYTLGGKLPNREKLKLVKEEDLPKIVDLFIVFGGDGTVLRLSRIINGKEIPILAVNAGKLGFLTDLSPENLSKNIDKILNGDYHVEERLMIEGKVEDKSFKALNDIVVSKGQFPRIIKIKIDIEKHHVNTYYSDGIIFATPTGSTAYSLSSGGPIAHPNLEVIIITPLATHSLSARPVVTPAGKVISTEILSKNIKCEFMADGRKVMNIEAGKKLQVTKSKSRIKLIKIESKNFFDVLRNKLNWGRESR